MPDAKLGERLLTQLIDQIENQGDQVAADFYNSLSDYEKESLALSLKNTVDELIRVLDELSKTVAEVQGKLEAIGDAQFRLEQMLEQEGGDE